MKYRPATQLATIGQAGNAKQFSISAKNFSKIASILSGLYPYPVPAIVREYLTNGRDSHLDAGQLRPIEVTLTDQLFAVEDFGIGLSIDKLTKIWTEYGESTKEDDEDQTGALGLGSKSAFSYADQFTVISRHDGVQAIGFNFKDSAGVPQFDIVDTSATTEPNGVRVEIPLKGNDRYRFQDALNELLVFWPSGSVLVNGKPNTNIADGDTPRLVLDDEVTVYRSHDDSVLVSGGVPYTVPDHRLGLNFQEQVVAHVPLGSLDFTPARELEYSDKTLAVIDMLKDYVKERKAQVFQEMIDNAPTPWDGLLAMNDWGKRAVLQGRFRYFQVSRGYKRRGYGMGITASKSEGQIGVGTLANSNVIIGFPRKSVSERHKEILEHHDLHKDAVLVPTKVAHQIEGHPNVYVWKDLVDSAPKPERTKREKGAKTEYVVVDGATGFHGTLTEGDDHGFDNLYFSVGNPSDGYSTRRIAPLQTLGLIPSGTVGIAVIREVSRDKFQRLYPEAKPAYEIYDPEAVRERAQKASASVIEERAWDTNTSYSSFNALSYLDVSRIADPELRELAQRTGGSRSDDSAEYQALQELNVVRYIPEAPVELQERIARINDSHQRYPLLSLRNIDSTIAESLLTAINNEYRLRTLQGL